MKILQVTMNPFPPEIRVYKEAISFKNLGYISGVLSLSKSNEKEFEIINGIHVFRPSVLNKINIFDKIYSFCNFYNHKWSLALKEVINEFNPDCIHYHDIWLGKNINSLIKKEKVIIDLHENMPAAVDQWKKGANKFEWILRYFFQKRKRLFYLERDLITRADHILVVVKEAKERLLLDHPNIASDKVSIVENFEQKRFLNNSLAELNKKFDKNLFKIVYIGGVNPERGLDTFFYALNQLDLKKLKLNSTIYGANNSFYSLYLKSLVKKLGIGQHVKIFEWVESKKVLSLMQKASICVIPHKSNDHTDFTIPHKIYQYMMAKKPIIVSSSPPLKRVIKASKSGFIFKAGDYMSCAKTILKAYKLRNKLDSIGLNGYNYVTKQGYNWEQNSEKELKKIYENIHIK